MLKFNDIKNIELNKMKYFNKGDVEYWGTNTSLILAEKDETEQLLFIVDNTRFDKESEKYNYKLKVYNYDKKEIQTLYSTENYGKIIYLLNYIKNIKNLNDSRIETLLSGEIIEKEGQLEINSKYLRKMFVVEV